MKRIAVIVCVALLASGVGFASAYFTARQLVPDNIVRAGSVAVVANPTAKALSMENLAPGTAQSRVLTVTNTGSLPADIRISGARRSGITAFYQVLQCVVSVGDQTVYNGSLSAMATSPVRLGPAESVDLQFAIMIPPDADNTFAGDHTGFTLHVDAEQVR